MGKKVKVKVKTKRAAAKRFKVTGKGKILHRKQFTGCGHLRGKKDQKRKRQLKGWKEVAPEEYYKVRMMIPYKF